MSVRSFNCWFGLDAGCGPRYSLYKPPKKAANIKFEVGMMFNSLQDFKTAVTDYAVNGGWAVTFVKNDKIRVRAVWKEGCKWTVYCSKMRDQMNYLLHVVGLFKT